MAKAKPKSPFTGRWRIVSMSAWDDEYINEEEEGFFEFDEKGGGELHFGYVHGHMDCKLTTREGAPAVEWTWDGNDEMDPAQGQGWAVVKGGELRRHDLLPRRRRFGVRGEESRRKEGEEKEVIVARACSGVP